MLCDTAPDGTVVQFVRIYLEDGTTRDTAIGGGDYTPSVGGTVGQCTADQTDGCDTTTPVTAAQLCLADGTPVAVLVQRDCEGTISAPGWVNLATGVYTAGTLPAGAATCEQIAAAGCDTTMPITTEPLCLVDGTPIAVVMQRDCDGVVTSPGYVTLTTGVFTAGAVPAGAGTCEQIAAAECDTTTPLATTGLCLADGTPIATVATRDCDGVITQNGWINLTTGGYTTGLPPAGTIACGAGQSIQVSGVFCDVDPATGEVYALVLVEYTYDEAGAIESVRLVRADDATTYTLQGTLSICPGTGTSMDIEGELLCLRDAAGALIQQVFAEFGYDTTTGERLFVRFTDPTTGAVIAPPAGAAVGECTDPCERCETLVLCHTVPEMVDTSEATVTVTAEPAATAGVPLNYGGPIAAPLPEAAAFFSGGAANVGPNAINEHVYLVGGLTLDPDCGDLDPAGTSELTITARIDNTGANCGCGLWGRFTVWDTAGPTNLAASLPPPNQGGNLGALNDAANFSICPGEVWTPTRTVTVPNSAILAGTVKVELNVQTGTDTTPDGAGCPVNNPGGTTYTLDQFAATVTPVAVTNCTADPGEPVQFLRHICRSCDGTVTVTNTQLDAVTPYDVGDGVVTTCPGNLGTATVECETVRLCDSSQVPVRLSTTEILATRYRDIEIPNPGDHPANPITPVPFQPLFNGGAVDVPIPAAQNANGAHTWAAGRVDLDDCTCPGATVQVTVTTDFHNNGPAVQGGGGTGLYLFNGDTLVTVDGAPNGQPADTTETLTVTATVPLEDITAGLIAVVFQLEGSQGVSGQKTWTLSNYAVTATVDCGRPFLRTLCRDGDGVVVSTTDTLDGSTTYLPVGAVKQCGAEPRVCSGSSECAGGCETETLCNLDRDVAAVLPSVGSDASAEQWHLLANGVRWHRDGGTGGMPGGWYNAGPETFRFDRAVEVRYQVRFSSGTAAPVRIPAGWVVDGLVGAHNWNESTRILSPGPQATSGLVSTFEPAGLTTTQLDAPTLVGTQPAGQSSQFGQITVTADVLTSFQRTTCRACDGSITSTITTAMDGTTPYDPPGEVGSCDLLAAQFADTEECLRCSERVLCDNPGTTAFPATILGPGSTGTLPNGVTWTARGTGGVAAATETNADGAWWGIGSFPNPQTTPYTWTFSRPVDVVYSIGLQYNATLANRQVRVPLGSEPVSLPPGYLYDAAAGIVEAAPSLSSCPPITDPTKSASARFRLKAVTSFTLAFLGARIAACGQFGNYRLGGIEVTPATTQFLRVTCRNCVGEIVGEPTDTTLDGVTPYAVFGTAGACEDCQDCETVTLCDVAGDPTDWAPVDPAAINGATTLAANGIRTGLVTNANGTLTGGTAPDTRFARWSLTNNGAVGSITVDRPAQIRFLASITENTSVRLPPGSVVERLAPNHAYNANQHTLTGRPGAQVGGDGTAGFDAAANLSTIYLPRTVANRADIAAVLVLAPPAPNAFGFDNIEIAPAPPLEFQRTVCRDCHGNPLTAPVDTTLDGTPYVVGGTVMDCARAANCRDCETIELCDDTAPNPADRSWYSIDHGSGACWQTETGDDDGGGGGPCTLPNGLILNPTVGFASLYPTRDAIGIVLNGATIAVNAPAQMRFSLSIAAGSTVALPAGTRLVNLAAQHTWNAATSVLGGAAGSTATGPGAQLSTFYLPYTEGAVFQRGGAGAALLWDMEAAPVDPVTFLRRICRDCNGLPLGAPVDTLLDGITPFAPGGEVRVCDAARDCSCTPEPVCIQQDPVQVREFISNEAHALDGSVDPVWEWTPQTNGLPLTDPNFGPAANATWYDMYRPTAIPTDRWSITDTDTERPAFWITPHPNSGVIQSNPPLPGEGPNVPGNADWFGRAYFDLPANADPSSIQVQVTVLNADQYARSFRLNDGPWQTIDLVDDLGQQGGCFEAGPPENCEPYTFPAQPVPGAQAGRNTLYMRVHETVGGAAGVIAHMIVTYQVSPPARRSWTRMRCCDGSFYYLDESGQRHDDLPTGWVVAPCGSGESDPVLLCDDNGPFLRHVTYLADGSVSVSDTSIDGGDYTPAGTPQACGGTGGGCAATTSTVVLCDVQDAGGPGATVAVNFAALNGPYPDTVTLANGVAVGVDQGGYNAQPPTPPGSFFLGVSGTDPQVWTFDQPSTVRFRITPANVTGNTCLQLPAGAVVENVQPGVTHNAGTNQLCQTGSITTTTGTTVRVDNTSGFQVSVSGAGAGNNDWTFRAMEVTPNATGGGTTAFLRHITTDCEGTVIVTRDTTLDGQTIYMPGGTVEVCQGGAAIAMAATLSMGELTAHHLDVVPGTPWTPDAIGWGAITALTYTVLSGTATVIDSNGQSIAGLPAGVTGTWSNDQQGDLVPPQSITAAPGSRVLVAWTER